MLKLLKVEEVAEILGVKKSSILQRIRWGTFPIKATKLENRLVRIKLEDLENYLENLQIHPGQKGMQK